MRKWFAIVALAASFASPATLKADLWVGGHGDIGIGLVGNTLDLHLHFADAVDKGGGGSIPAGEYGPGDHTIFVPGPTVDRPAGSQWDFLGAPTDKIWFLPASNDPNKPYLGWATEELSPADFNGNITVRLTSLVSSPADSNFSVWSLDPFGTPNSLMSTANGISNADQFLLAPANHEHFFVVSRGKVSTILNSPPLVITKPSATSPEPVSSSSLSACPNPPHSPSWL